MDNKQNYVFFEDNSNITSNCSAQSNTEASSSIVSGASAVNGCASSTFSNPNEGSVSNSNLLNAFQGDTFESEEGLISFNCLLYKLVRLDISYLEILLNEDRFDYYYQQDLVDYHVWNEIKETVRFIYERRPVIIRHLNSIEALNSFIVSHCNEVKNYALYER